MQSQTTHHSGSLDAPAAWSLDRTVDGIREEFCEMPGMRLTRPQFRRLWSLSTTQCEDIVQELVRTGFLVEAATGQFRRRVDGVC
jgi:hypothetical protein